MKLSVNLMTSLPISTDSNRLFLVLNSYRYWATQVTEWVCSDTDPSAEDKDVKLLGQNSLIWQHKLGQVDDGCRHTFQLNEITPRHTMKLTAAHKCLNCCESVTWWQLIVLVLLTDLLIAPSMRRFWEKQAVSCEREHTLGILQKSTDNRLTDIHWLVERQTEPH